MPDLTISQKVGASGLARLDFIHGKTGIQWIVSQLSNSTSPFRVGSTLSIQRNNLYVTSTPLASGDTATGPPFLLLNAADVLSFIFSGMTSGDQVLATIYYSEHLWSPNPQGGVVV